MVIVKGDKHEKLIVRLSAFIAFSLFMVSHEAIAQVLKPPDAPPPTSEQSLQQLVSEVRQLRAALQRINVAAYRAQVMIERLKLQQEQVARLSREVNETRENLNDTRAQTRKVKQMMGQVEHGGEAGVKNENELLALKLDLNSL